MHIETLAVHAGHGPDPSTGAVTPPIHLSTTYVRDAEGGYPHGYVYSRTANPNRDALEKCLCVLEGGESAAAFASGSAATLAVFQSLRPGDHVVAPNDAYYGTAHLLRGVMQSWGLASTFVDVTDSVAVRAALRPETKLVWIETPSNPLVKITDIAVIAALAHENGALCVCDNTWATPVLQRPFERGADIVMHATTKYLGGHSDVLGGILVSRAANGQFERIRELQRSGGAVAAPFDCWLVHRGIRTLPLRVRAQSDSALKIARYLNQHPHVTAVHYPGLETSPWYETARKQMSAFGGMLSFQVPGGKNGAMSVAGKVSLITRATSLGGTETLIEHRASVEGPGTSTPKDLLRLSVGLENTEDLIADLESALA